MGGKLKYNVTTLYSKSKEYLIASFRSLQDAMSFITQKMEQDEINKLASLYRIYNDSELLNEFNNEVKTLVDPEDPEAYSNAKFSFTVQAQNTNALERDTVAYFNDKDDARLFIINKFRADDKSVDLATFMIYKNQVLIATITKNLIDKEELKGLIASGESTGPSLSPLPTRPTPPGGPGDCWKEPKEDLE